MLIHTSQCTTSRVTSWYVKVKEKQGRGKRKTNIIRTTSFLNINYVTLGVREPFGLVFFLSHAQALRPGIIHPLLVSNYLGPSYGFRHWD